MPEFIRIFSQNTLFFHIFPARVSAQVKFVRVQPAELKMAKKGTIAILVQKTVCQIFWVQQAELNFWRKVLWLSQLNPRSEWIYSQGVYLEAKAGGEVRNFGFDNNIKTKKT